MVYSNWAAGEPNNFGMGEDSAMFYNHGSSGAAPDNDWNDVPGTLLARSYIVEYDTQPTPVPSGSVWTWTLLVIGLLAGGVSMHRFGRASQ